MECLLLVVVLAFREMLYNSGESSGCRSNGDRRDEVFLHLVSFGSRGGIGGFHQKRRSREKSGS